MHYIYNHTNDLCFISLFVYAMSELYAYCYEVLATRIAR